MNGIEKRAIEKREAVLDAALKLFAANGIRQTCVAAIAEKAQISQVTLYKYFGSKQDLARCVVERYYDRLLADFIEVIDGRLPFSKKIEQAFFTPIQKEKDTNSIFWEDLLGDGFVDIVFSYEQKLMPYMLRLIEEGQRSGCIARGYSNETMLFYIRVFSAQAVQSFAGAGQDKDWQKKYYELVNLLLYGLRGEREDYDD